MSDPEDKGTPEKAQGGLPIALTSLPKCLDSAVERVVQNGIDQEESLEGKIIHDISSEILRNMQ